MLIKFNYFRFLINTGSNEYGSKNRVLSHFLCLWDWALVAKVYLKLIKMEMLSKEWMLHPQNENRLCWEFITEKINTQSVHFFITENVFMLACTYHQTHAKVCIFKKQKAEMKKKSYKSFRPNIIKLILG